MFDFDRYQTIAGFEYQVDLGPGLGTPMENCWGGLKQFGLTDELFADPAFPTGAH